MRSLQMTQAQLFSMHKQAQVEEPKEACGLLAGKDGIVTMVIPVQNIAAAKTKFQMDPRAQLRAMELIDIEKLELLGIYHSHPKGPSYPSATDLRENQYQVIHVICSKAGRKWMSKAFELDQYNFVEVPLDLRG